MRLILVSIAALLVLAAPGAAAAAPPPNDARSDAQRIGLNDTVDGTVKEATLDKNEVFSSCANTDATVWYRFTPPASGSVVLQFDAGGNLDASVDVYERTRSQLSPVGCDTSDKKGQLTLGLDDLDPEKEYLIQVGKLADSDPGDFTLGVLVARPPAAPPGKPLRRSAKDTVDRLLNPSDAYHRNLVGGTTYRVDLRKEGCLGLEIYGPGTRDFDGDTEKSLRCGGYRLFTPERSGRFYFVVTAGRRRGAQPYRVGVAPAGPDDTAPGVFIRNNAKVRGKVNGRLDSVDLYRFDVVRRSSLLLRVSGGPELQLLSEHGRRLGSGSDIEGRIKPGRYFVAVRGEGKYRLRRISRAITHSVTLFNGHRKSHASPGSSVTLSLNVRPGVSGRGVILLERFDPLSGWQYVRRYRVNVSGGRAAVSFVPKVGHYRAISEYRGSHIASPSSTGYAKLNVSGPLVE
jgi:hypothetical protein